MSERKQALFMEIERMEKELCKYRGILHNEYSVDNLSDKLTIAQLENIIAKKALMLSEPMPMPMATERQLSYIDKLFSTDERVLFAGKTINRYQASQIIGLLLEGKDLINRPMSCNKDFEENYNSLKELSNLCSINN